MTNSKRSRSVALYAPLGSFSGDYGPAAYAPGLCKAVGASLTGLLFNIEANLPPAVAARNLDQMEQDSADRETANAANVSRLETLCRDHAVPVYPVTKLDHSRGLTCCVADHGRVHDVLVIGTSRTGMLSDRVMAEHLLFQTGRPMIVVPAAHQPGPVGNRIVAAWDNSANSARALGDALSLLPQTSEVVLLTIGDEKAIWSSLGDSDLVAALSRRGISVQVEHRGLRKRKIGDALQESALELGGDMLVMGGCGHSRMRDFFLGGATMSVLDTPRLPVLLSH